MRVEIARLRGQIADDRAAAARHFDRLAALSPLADDEGDIAIASLALHHAYSAIESAMERCMVTLEGSRPAGPSSHRDVLDGAAREVPGVRPALISKESARQLRELLGFRHFLHHAYEADLQHGRVAALMQHAAALRPRLDTDLDALDSTLAQLADA